MNLEQKTALGHIALAKITSLIIPFLLLIFVMAALAGQNVSRHQGIVISIAVSFAGTVAGLYYLKETYFIDLRKQYFSGSMNTVLKWGFGIGSPLYFLGLLSNIKIGDEIVNHRLFIGFSADWLSGIVFGVFVVILGPITEELFYRGLIFGIIKERFQVWLAYAISSLLFVVGHHNHISAFLMGLIFCWVFERSKNLGAPILVHMLENASWLIVSYVRIYWVV